MNIKPFQVALHATSFKTSDPSIVINNFRAGGVVVEETMQYNRSVRFEHICNDKMV